MSWPTTDTPRDNMVSLRLSDDELAAVDEIADSTGQSRSTVLRQALTEFAYSQGIDLP